MAGGAAVRANSHAGMQRFAFRSVRFHHSNSAHQLAQTQNKAAALLISA
jgi:hypothetical protein